MVGLVLPVAGVPVAVKFMPVLRAKAPPPQGSTLAAPIGALRRVAVPSQPRETRRLTERVQRHD